VRRLARECRRRSTSWQPILDKLAGRSACGNDLEPARALLLYLHHHPFCRVLSRDGAECFAKSDADLDVYAFLLQKKRK
jgi:hypothetical protein